MGLHPSRDRLANGGSGILLDEMRPRNRHLGLVFKTPAEIPDTSDQDRAGLGIDEQFRNLALGQPPRIVGYDLHHGRGLSRDRDLPRPRQAPPVVAASLT